MNNFKILIRDQSLGSTRELYDILYNPVRTEELITLVRAGKIVIYSEENTQLYGNQKKSSLEDALSILAV
jgi:hypothetical protein